MKALKIAKVITGLLGVFAAVMALLFEVPSKMSQVAALFWVIAFTLSSWD